MNHKAQLACAWIGLASTALLFVGIWPLMHFLPPLDPALPTAAVAAIYRANGTGIIVGGLCLLAAASALSASSAFSIPRRQRRCGASTPRNAARPRS